VTIVFAGFPTGTTVHCSYYAQPDGSQSPCGTLAVPVAGATTFTLTSDPFRYELRLGSQAGRPVFLGRAALTFLVDTTPRLVSFTLAQ